MRHQPDRACRLKCARQRHGYPLRPSAVHAGSPVRETRHHMSDPASVSIVTQTCVRPESAESFAWWRGGTSAVIAGFPGFIEQRLMPPNPPLQVDWVILQRFDSLDHAKGWLASPERQTRIQ